MYDIDLLYPDVGSKRCNELKRVETRSRETSRNETGRKAVGKEKDSWFQQIFMASIAIYYYISKYGDVSIEVPPDRASIFFVGVDIFRARKKSTIYGGFRVAGALKKSV